MRINVVTKGTAELASKLERLDRKVATGFWVRFFEDAGKEIGEEFGREVQSHRRSGAMQRAGVGTKVQLASPNGGKARVRPKARHWHLLEYGHRLVRGSRKSGRQRVIGQVQGYPVLRPAAKRARKAIIELFARQVKEVVRQA